ncbi:MAG: DNA-3-methyladenine glycosylase family protein [Bacillota bacterium]
MQVRFDANSAWLTDISCFEPRHIFECGQCFRFVPDSGGYTGVAHGRVLHVEKHGQDVRLWPCSKQEYDEVWRHYFDLDTDYDKLLNGLPMDGFLQASVSYGRGLRLLRQPPFETLITFILSANNNVSRIRSLVERLCRAYGEPVEEGLFDFPSPAALAAASEDDFRALGTGYRAAYIRSAAKAVADGFDLNALAHLPYAEAKKVLQMLDGVGPKVADCVLLFALGHRCAFVQDVWIRRVLRDVYHAPHAKAEAERFIQARFGEYGGIVQQYLFHYARSMKKLQPQDIQAREMKLTVQGIV